MNKIGIDVGSTTIKLVVLDGSGELDHYIYQKHNSNIQRTLLEVLEEYQRRHGNVEGKVAITGSGGISVAKMLDLPFVQEVVATTLAIRQAIPQANAIVELGGEDAKVVYLDDPIEQRMNATCAGGTGGFIDSIASMLGIHTFGMNVLSMRGKHVYPIASRCAVFAQADARPLVNVGVTREDIAGSALEAVVKQTIGGLACGRPIEGNVVFLGGPFEYIPDLYTRFCNALKLEKGSGIRPEKAHLYTARGAALAADDKQIFPDLENDDANLTSLSRLSKIVLDSELDEQGLARLQPLFEDESAQDEFFGRHATLKFDHAPASEVSGPVFIGIDAGAAHVKVAAVDEQGRVFAHASGAAGGDSLSVAARTLEKIYEYFPNSKGITVARTLATGSGDETIQYALRCDSSVVETAAHVRAARQLVPDATAVIDAGAQDVKVLRLDDGEIIGAALNDPCSSSCGLFYEETAADLQTTPARFSDYAFDSAEPVELDTKCIVFMNSRIRHAQKVGASRNDIAAGLAFSIAKNIYQRVIAASLQDDLGETIVVQGGLFESDAILRAFEIVSGHKVMRASDCMYMGAVGAALMARDQFAEAQAKGNDAVSTVISKDELATFDPIYSSYICPGCESKCMLSIVTYGSNGIFVSGNSCMRGAEIVKEESRKLSSTDILGSSSMLPRSKGSLRARNVSEVGNGIVIPGYLRSFSGGMVGGGGSVGAAEEPRRVDYYASQLEKDRTRERKIKLIAPTKYLSPDEVGRQKIEASKSEEQRRKEAEQREAEEQAKLSIEVVSSTRMLRKEGKSDLNVAEYERELLSAYVDQEGSGKRAGVAVGLVNVLNEYAQVPFWHTFFSTLGYSVLVPDPEQTGKYAVAGAESIPSESVCAAAKTAHARAHELVDRGANILFMPTYERKGACPVLNGYASALSDSLVSIRDFDVQFASPAFADLEALRTDRAAVLESVKKALEFEGLSDDEMDSAFDKARAAQQSFESELEKRSEEVLEWLRADKSRHAVVLALRPYHVDMEISHGVDSVLANMGHAVLTPLGLSSRLEKFASEEGSQDERLVQLAKYTLADKQLDVVFLQSFNCGYDAFAVERARDVLFRARRPFAALKIDEMPNMAHLSLKLRTLFESDEYTRSSDSVMGLSDTDEVLETKTGEFTGAFDKNLDASEVESARSLVSPDVCFTAAAVLARIDKILDENPDVGVIHAPLICKDCLCDQAVSLVKNKSKSDIKIVWDELWSDKAKALQTPVADSGSRRVKIGLVGNPMLCFDEFMNEGVVSLLESLGADAILPDPDSLAAEDVRFFDQMDKFADQNADGVLYLVNPNCLKSHVQARGALHEYKRRYPQMPVTILDYDPESSALNRENRIRLLVTAAARKKEE